MNAPNPLPFPIRIAAGLAATAVDEARKLPDHLVGLPMTVASRLLQTSMRMQQQITDLALKGDEVFAQFQSVEDNPPWARFDEDSEPGGHGSLATVLSGPGAPPEADVDVPEQPPEVVDVPEQPPEVDDLSEADVARALTPPTPAGQAPAHEHPGAAGIDGPPLPGYDELTLPQLRGKLRKLSLGELEALAEYEQAHQDRPPFVTMLSNRINTVRSR